MTGCIRKSERNLIEAKKLLSLKNVLFTMHTDSMLLVNVRGGVNVRLNLKNLKWYLTKKKSFFEKPEKVTANLITGQGIDQMITAIGELKKLTTKKEMIAEVKRKAAIKALPKAVKDRVKADKVRAKRWSKVTPANLLYKLKCGEISFKEGSSLSKSARINHVKYDALKNDLLSKGYHLNCCKKK
ncbi:hypothetical protein GCM10007916_00370 [Psychromonas marina]|uniref:HNH endonuclease n=1 Tax=Psychromonas marina TaxID=88364 RepID=A0ABQ6DVH9_9GAMM|nr:hypothetical protein [Psychromonas marina]GLS88970.1 hypothetical protein GCM10007916_00370 [Psychromonas marina]